MGDAVDDLGRLVDFEQTEIRTAADIEENAPGVLDRRLEQRTQIAARAAAIARPSPLP